MTEYIFTESQYSPELERLRALEQVFDPQSKAKILSTGIKANWQCLEVGAGAGSIVEWLCGVVGEEGKVTAIDLDPRFLSGLSLSNLEVVTGDIREFPFLAGAFDLIHTRFVLVHIPDYEDTLLKMINLLKPGGWLVLEEPEFDHARAIVGESEACKAFDRVGQAISQMFVMRGLEQNLGVKLPSILQRSNLNQISAEYDAHFACGGSGITKMMKMSAIQLAEKYISTHKTSSQDIEQYCAFLDDPQTWAIYYATVRTLAQVNGN